MSYEDRTRAKLQPFLDHHSNIDIELGPQSFRTILHKHTPNLLGNFAGGDMAYAANAAAGLVCVVDGTIAETASINIECLSRGDGEFLVSDATIVRKGRKLIRTRVDVFVRKGSQEKLVAIAQINMAPVLEKDLPEAVKMAALD